MNDRSPRPGHRTRHRLNESVTPEPVEAAPATLPGIAEVAVFGVPNERWGEVVCAAVVATADLSLADLRAHVDSDGAAPLANTTGPAG